MTTAIQTIDKNNALIERIVIAGDLAQLTVAERVSYYLAMCDRYGLDPISKPFDYIVTEEDGKSKISLYPNQVAAAQLREKRKITIEIVSREVIEGCYQVIARAKTVSGRSDEASGIVALEGKYGAFKGQSKANAMMKAEGKARRRVTMSICGFSFDDEDESKVVSAEIMDAGVDFQTAIATTVLEAPTIALEDTQVYQEFIEYLAAADTPEKLNSLNKWIRKSSRWKDIAAIDGGIRKVEELLSEAAESFAESGHTA